MNSKKNLKRNLLICLLAGSAVMYTLPLHAATSVIGNGTLPSGGSVIAGDIQIPEWAKPGGTNSAGNLEMNITQNSTNGIISWGSFDVGGSATVNFKGPESGYNTLNYVNGGNMSQIYGTINANNNGNIFIVNPAGVQIGNSAQINVGSLYVSNQNLDTVDWSSIPANTDVNTFLNQYDTHTNAELMSLGNINITNVKNGNVTFEGNGRIVIDTERIKSNDLVTENFIVRTNDANNVLLGYDAYVGTDVNNDGTIDGYAGQNKTFANNVFVNNSATATAVEGYMWVEDVEQLQAINTNLSGNYALRNSIDATATSSWNDEGTDTDITDTDINEGFKSIGIDENGYIIKTDVNTDNGVVTKNGFYGNFDGLDYNIFGLTINRSVEDNVGLFGAVDGATINNVTLVGGEITGNIGVGAIVGLANNSVISNSTNSTAVNGNYNIGGIVGDAQNSTLTNLINTGTIGAATGDGNRIGGLVGNLQESSLGGNSYNLGAVTSVGHDVGGLVGHAYDATIGDGTNLVYNRLDVTGAYNVGGIVGNMEGSTVQNAENSGTVLATGYDDGNYTFHTDYTGNGYSTGGSKTVAVNVANAGGIAGSATYVYKQNNGANIKVGSTIKEVTNTGDVSSSKQNGNDFYDAGNVGGIIGSAVDTNISNATNKENEVRGAHNVGGVAGYFSGAGRITGGINDGGDIMATGARYTNNGITAVVTETIRKDYDATNNDGKYVIGNIGGIVGYMEGDYVHIDASGNRGTVHTLDISDGNNISDASEAANVGGIVGKIDRSRKITDKNELGEKYVNAAVSNSYNTGDVRGFTAIGGIAGMMYNGGIAGAYNLGEIRSTRVATGNETPLNMGGIVGDTTEVSNARAFIYDVYNKGKIGDEAFKYKGRHVGGIVGRLSGVVEKAYNTGAIYNGAAVTGGIAGYLSAGKIENVFNTGNITVENNDGEDLGTQLGGLVGAANIGRGNVNISNAYNLGVIRSFNGTKTQHNVGGIVGFVVNYSSGLSTESKGNLNIKNVYTTGDLYSDSKSVGAVYGSTYRDVDVTNDISISNVVYIKPTNNDYINADAYSQRATPIDGVYDTNNDTNNDTNYAWKQFITNSNEDSSDLWRVYNGTTPILNEYLPNSKKYFDNHNDIEGITNIQYGTAYNPLLTIIEASKDLSFDWQQLGINNDAGLAVYGAGVTLDNFKATGGTGYYGGTIYADGNLKLDGNRNDISLGSASQIYGSSVTIETDGKVTIYGDVTATGNTANGATSDTSDVIDVKDKGNITITAGDVDVYGQLTSATEGEATNIAGIGKEYGTINNVGDIKNKYDDIANMGDHYVHTTGEAAENGDITIKATETKLVVDDNGNPILDAEGNEQYVDDGDVNIYYGNKEHGLITTGGDLTVTGTGDVYVDSDLDIGGDLTLEGTGADSEVVLDITNIGQVRGEEYISRLEDAVRGIELTNSNRENIINAILEAGITNDQQEAGRLAARLINSSFEDFGDEKSLEYFHEFMHHFSKVGFGDGTQAGNAKITLNAGQSGNTKLTIDMWNDVTETYDLTKYDEKNTASSNNHTLLNELNNLNIVASTLDTDGGVENTYKAQKVTYIWVSSGEQLKGIQDYYDAHKNDEGGTGILSYNFALKGDINASDVSGYEAIGTNSANGFTGTFDGRGNRIIGLNVSATDSANNNTNAGIFSTVGTDGVVKDVNIYSGNFTGTTNAGAVAGVNNGRIEGIVTFGNTVTSKGNAGGIVGVNNSGKFTDDKNDGELTNGIYDVESTGSVIAGNSNAVAGGLVGTNNGGLANSFSDSAVTVGINVTGGTSAGLGGVVGVNTEKGNVQYVDSLGVTNGGATGSSNIGGIIGTNKGNMYSGYNESIVSGADNVGGIIGTNAEGKKVENVVNATGVEGTNNVGGLIGDNRGNVTNGRNNGTITGNKNVGGMVGINGENSTLTNLVNDSSAAITGEQYVGGIAGTNAGTITAQNQSNLINRGSITGQNYVGGVAGENIGTIEYVKNDVNLYVKDDTKTAQYFGGVAGINGRVDATSTTEDETATGTITSATNEGDVVAENAQYVGGIVGWNTSQGKLVGMGNSNEGTVIGGSYVGGVIGKNDAAIGSKGSAQVGITNEGTVIATKGGAGGLIGENNAAITNTVMTNRGEVHGNNTNDGSGTGGLIGTNNKGGDITYSSLINEVTGTVTGTNNVGGLIGVNKADITGGRYTVAGEDAGMYINKIYNNGVINVGTYGDTDKDGDYEFKVGTGSNIGGLIGDNKGSLTAGYNTGAINASGSTNVGGIAGSNSGKIDQVFNTVITADGKNTGTITGGTNVGGLVGNNSGTLSNAYNTTGVTGDYKFGNAVGNNTGEITNIYASNTTGILIGAGYENGKVYNAYSFVSDDKSATGVITGDAQKDSDSHEGFDFDTDGSGIWKNYDGYSNPLLKVFLTKAYYDSATGQLVAAADDFKAHQNAEGGLIFQGGLNNLWSIQIRFGNGNPNWLGYDLEGITYMPDENWYYFLDDAPFDRNKDFRERKAEVNFVDGGMEI